jgi:ubiquinone/menaquinone biosynthesis C-methylase UbiE
MDYDRSDIAGVYDEARAFAPGALRQWLDLLSAYVGQQTIALVVDLGCGTGRFTGPLADHFGARVIGIDPSQKMLEQARRKLMSERVTFERASAEALPISDDAVDMVFMSMVFHHLSSRTTVAKECWRVLRNGGHLFIRNSTREADFPYRHFFPTMQPLIESELPTRRDVSNVFDALGFTSAGHKIVEQVVAMDWRQFVSKSCLRADSFLARLSEEDYEAGMTALRAHAARDDAGEPVIEEVDLFVFAKQT